MSTATQVAGGANVLPRRRRSRSLRTVLGALALGLTGAVYWAWPVTVEQREMHSSYAYDVTDLTLLNGQADNIVLAEVNRVVEVDQTLGTTTFAVRVTDVVKGDLVGVQLVEQLGFTETTGKTHTTVEDDDQPLLDPGTEVLLTLGREPDGRNVVMGGPKSVVVLDGVDRTALKRERAAAARNAKPVRDASGRAVLPVKQRAVRG